MFGSFRKETTARMRIKSLMSIVLWSGVVFASQTQSCKYWCKASEENVYYCCPSGKPESWLGQSVWPIMSSPIFWIGVIGTSLGIQAHNKPPPQMEMPPMRKKMCPPTRSVCPRSFDWYNPPNYCDKDDECHPMEKCCFDVCLEHKTCKPAE